MYEKPLKGQGYGLFINGRIVFLFFLGLVQFLSQLLQNMSGIFLLYRHESFWNWISYVLLQPFTFDASEVIFFIELDLSITFK